RTCSVLTQRRKGHLPVALRLCVFAFACLNLTFEHVPNAQTSAEAASRQTRERLPGDRPTSAAGRWQDSSARRAPARTAAGAQVVPPVWSPGRPAALLAGFP